MAELLHAALGAQPATAVGGKRSDPPGGAPGSSGAGEARLRAALVGAIVGTLALAALLIVMVMRPTGNEGRALPPKRPAMPQPAPVSIAPTAASPPRAPPPLEDRRGVAELEQQFLGMKSSLSPRDRRAAMRALYARIDAGGGSVEERARRKREALLELIRQHGN